VKKAASVKFISVSTAQYFCASPLILSKNLNHRTVTIVKVNY